MENIALKIKELNYDENVSSQTFKFLAPLTMITLEDEKDIISFLESKDIKISKPSEQKVFALGLEFIKKQVEQMESIGHIKAYQDDPSRLCSKCAFNRLMFLIKKGIPYLNENGKYLPCIFIKKDFEKEFGLSYLRNEETFEIKVNENELVNNSSIKEDTQTDNVKESIIPLREVVDFTNNNKPVNNTEEKEVNIVEQILSSSQSISLNDDTYERYDRLFDLIPRILNVEEIPENISDNLIKLVTHDIPDDKVVLYYAITYGKNITPEEDQRIKNAIELELQTTTILDIDLRRIA